MTNLWCKDVNKKSTCITINVMVAYSFCFNWQNGESNWSRTMCLESTFTIMWSYDTNVTIHQIREGHYILINIFLKVTMSTERIRIFESLQKERITSKTCRNALFRTSDEIVISQVSAPDQQNHIFHVMCTSCTNKQRGQFFICISCGRINSRSAKMIKQNRCKCWIILSVPQLMFKLLETTASCMIPRIKVNWKFNVRVLSWLMI